MGLGQQMMDVITAAGYQVNSEEDFQQAVVAYNVATIFQNRARSNRSISSKPPRNGPCPCGSGKKYKKCCLQKGDKPSQTPSHLLPGRAVDPRLIPNTQNTKAFESDVALLAKLMLRLPTLGQLRFPIEEVTATVQEAEKNRKMGWLFNRKMSEKQLDDVAMQYAKDHAEPDRLSRARDAFVQSVPSVIEDADALRALALGYLLASIEETEPDKSLFSVLVFRATIRAQLKVAEALDDLIDKFGGRQEVRRRIEQGNLDLGEQERELIENSIPEDLRATLVRQAKESQDDLFEAIMDLDLPVGLPYSSTLPFIVTLAEARAMNDPDEQSMRRAFDGYRKQFCNEDEKIFLHFLDAWISQTDTASDREVELVANLRDAVRNGELQSLIPALIYASTETYLQFEFSDEPVAETIEQSLDPAFLKHHADFMQAQGYPAIAQRSRDLAAHLLEAHTETHETQLAIDLTHGG